jgi:hydrogenase nickel incorporation protein HypA/HybF
MHELGLMLDVVQKVFKVILEVGKLSGVVPEALEFCFAICTKGTVMAEAKLEFLRPPALGRCKKCEKEFDLVENNFSCPICGMADWDLISGREFIIKEIEVI